jgi:dTDP-4-dehydrorhamnose 3,5-epimerase
LKFIETPLEGAYIVEIEPIEDERGFFAKSWSDEDFGAQGLTTRVAQCGISFNRHKGTLRGMHYQEKPYEEAKLVRCTRGAIYDLIVDIRPSSPTYKQWSAFELTAENRRMLYVPEGFAHGFQALEDETEVYYQISELYHPEAARGIRWNDPALMFHWPLEVGTISERDRQFTDFIG